MKIKMLFIVLLFTVINVNAQVKVFLTKSDSILHTCLNIENQMLDTVIVSSKFKNFYLGWESSQGINILTYKNDNFFRLANYGDMQDQQYINIAKERFIFIPPSTTLSFDINLRRYFYNIKGDLSVEFEINYVFTPYTRKENTVPTINRITTNRIKVENGSLLFK
ncbi:hypothetical protein EV201_1230 [Ancylomarina subtilis]|uniref:Uncharacterized protein n=1 Tax=Ancylomarina subtilis TaxID=1639035 RepID=A0A4Q7VK37_9BACT|nr:hypothetical protein [Ancylomarina subtilis]RZT96591.1 hypothetical protein EV201_1230 [Ancylomarina subtilis]